MMVSWLIIIDFCYQVFWDSGVYWVKVMVIIIIMMLCRSLNFILSIWFVVDSFVVWIRWLIMLFMIVFIINVLKKRIVKVVIRWISGVLIVFFRSVCIWGWKVLVRMKVLIYVINDSVFWMNFCFKLMSVEIVIRVMMI